MTEAHKRYLAFIIVAAGFFMALLDSTIVTVSLPKISEYFQTNIETITWVINGYNLAFAVLLVTASRLGDQFGRKKLFVAGLIFFTLTSLLCALSTSVHLLIFFRVLQGLAAALVVPISMPLFLDLFPKEKSGAVVGAWGAISAIAAACGPALGGIITELLQWQWIFLINVPIGVVTIVFTGLLIKESYDETATRHLDIGGIVSLSLGSFALTLALIQANDKGWSSVYILSLLAAALIGLVSFVLVEWRSREPMLPLNLLRSREFSATLLGLFVFGVALMCGVFFLSFFLTIVLGMSQLKAGLIITMLPVSAMPFAVVAGPMSDRWGQRWFAVIGTAILCAGIYLFGQLSAYSSMTEILWRLAVAGAGLGLALPALVSASIKAVPAEKTGIASGVGNMARIIGMVFGVAVLVTLLTFYANRLVEQAKVATAKIITENTVLKQETKDGFLSALQSVRFSQNSRLPGESDITARFEMRKQQALEASSSEISRKITESVYKKQIAEVKQLYPRIHTIFIDSIAQAFSQTFRLMSALLTVGIVIAFFCEPLKKTDRQPAAPRERVTVAHM